MLYAFVVRGRPLRARNVPLLARKQAIAKRKHAAGRGTRETHRSGCGRVEAEVPMAGMMGVEDSTKRDVSFVSSEFEKKEGQQWCLPGK
jgi:hypothetical protein